MKGKISQIVGSVVLRLDVISSMLGWSVGERRLEIDRLTGTPESIVIIA